MFPNPPLASIVRPPVLTPSATALAAVGSGAVLALFYSESRSGWWVFHFSASMVVGVRSRIPSRFSAIE